MPLLFLGNSYTFRNDLDLVVAQLLEDAGAGEVESLRLAEAGYAFPDHVARVGTDPVWEEALVSGATAWEWGVLQDQSQIPGFYGEDAIWEESAVAGEQLDAWLAARGAETLLLLTWGRREGDDTNPTLYPDFPTMQDELTEGYVAYRDRFATEERPVWIAPAGLAFAAVYAEEADPADPTSLFWRLYDSDGSHPSPAGTWLAACAIYSAITGASAEGLPAAAGVDPTEAEHLAALAWEVVDSGAGGLTYAWQNGGGDTGGGDTAGETGEADDSGDTTGDTAGEGGDTAGGAGSDGEKAGCGCTSGSAAPGSWLGLLLAPLAALRRGRRSPRAPLPPPRAGVGGEAG